MFSVQGKIINVFETPGGTDKKTGATYDPSCKIQLLGEMMLKTGAIKNELLTLTVPPAHVTEYKDQVGTDVSISVGIFVSGGKIQPFIPA